MRYLIAPIILLLFHSSLMSTDISKNTFRIRDWSKSCVENCLDTSTKRLFVNEQKDGLFRIEYIDDRYPRLYIYLRQGDSLSLSADTTLLKVQYQTELQSLADLADLNTGYQQLVDVFKLFRTETPEDFISMADSMMALRLDVLEKLGPEIGTKVPQEWLDAEYCNIITFPLNVLRYFLEDSIYTKYAESILNEMLQLPQNLLSRSLIGNAANYVDNYITFTTNVTIFQQPDYYNELKKYYKGEVLEHVFASGVMSGCNSPANVEELDALFNFALTKVSDVQLRKVLLETKESAVKNRLNFLQNGISTFHPALSLQGDSFAHQAALDKETFIMLSASGCGPCIKASKWLAEHYEAVKDKANIYSIVIGSVDRFKREQEKNPYPWPVFYDESGEIKSQLPRASVPQYYLVQDGQLVHADTPEPQEYFRDWVEKDSSAH
jgi:thiol-disulfide isomerase/thioredoxin